MAIGKKTGGRKKGTPNRVTARREREIAASGTTPLEHMLKVMRDDKASDERRDEMAKAAAPYVHPKLASMQHTGANGGPVQIADISRLKGMTPEELKILERALVQIGIAEGDQGGTGEPED